MVTLCFPGSSPLDSPSTRAAKGGS